MNRFAAFSLTFITWMILSCCGKNPAPGRVSVDGLHLKRGEVIACGPPDRQFGSVDFAISCSGTAKKDFNVAMELLHSFEYDEAEKEFAKVIDAEPRCAMAYWGVAMCNYHLLWTPPAEAELVKGSVAIEIARSLKQKTRREQEYIEAAGDLFDNWKHTDHHTRCVRFEKAMEKLSGDFNGDKEAMIFYALSLDASADIADTSFRNQKKAGAILTALYPAEPNHPGIAHYLIHTYDYPGLAPMALEVARKYASIAPSSAHAQHMPSHIFTRLGLWDECISSNLASVASAQCYAESAGLKGHWDEELHGLDYLVYAYLQIGEDSMALDRWNYLKKIKQVSPVNFKVAYAFAAIPSRYVLENKLWKEAAALELEPKDFPWNKFPWQEAILHFTRLLGSVHQHQSAEAHLEFKKIADLCDTLTAQKDFYKAGQVKIQLLSSEAWLDFSEGKSQAALRLMNQAAETEDKTEKHPVTPCEVIPARELLADMLMEMNKYGEALDTYKADLKRHPGRFNGIYGAATAAEKRGERGLAGIYYRQLLEQSDSTYSDRGELKKARIF